MIIIIIIIRIYSHTYNISTCVLPHALLLSTWMYTFLEGELLISRATEREKIEMCSCSENGINRCRMGTKIIFLLTRAPLLGTYIIYIYIHLYTHDAHNIIIIIIIILSGSRIQSINYVPRSKRPLLPLQLLYYNIIAAANKNGYIHNIILLR